MFNIDGIEKEMVEMEFIIYQNMHMMRKKSKKKKQKLKYYQE